MILQQFIWLTIIINQTLFPPSINHSVYAVTVYVSLQRESYLPVYLPIREHLLRALLQQEDPALLQTQILNAIWRKQAGFIEHPYAYAPTRKISMHVIGG